MYKVTKIDSIDNEVLQEIEVAKDETPVIVRDRLYLLDQDEYKKYKNGTLETFDTPGDNYITKSAPYHTNHDGEKFVIEKI